MNNRSPLTFLAAAVLLALTACSNIGEKRTLLTTAGFRTVPATTPAQVARLKSMKAGKVVALNGKQGTVYVFADPSKNALMVGSPSQFRQYRVLKQRQQQVDEQLLDAQMNMDDADWSAWGPGATDWGWGVASDPL